MAKDNVARGSSGEIIHSENISSHATFWALHERQDENTKICIQLRGKDQEYRHKMAGKDARGGLRRDLPSYLPGTSYATKSPDP